MKKVYDLAVKTGSYTNREGEQKNRYQNIGSVMEGDNGQFIILERTFNPAGVSNPENRTSIVVSMFTPKDKPALNNGHGDNVPPPTDDDAPTPFNDCDEPQF